ncbi:ATP-binding protein [Nocardiopsis exhalans]|uniref:ATP-binding protein n=1 Tax=Nocardiopsis exhalans TaxID=163604 RepID=A0ABY5DHD9_9ACTN|nr:ATP-binding protein [Nocardiopsis exhalans]USY22415.1 ATP-binding protein [Nocardiopsis exhalans]
MSTELKQHHKALKNLGGKLRASDRTSRTQRIEAAHGLLLLVSFFKPLDDCLTETGLRLRAADLELSGDEQQALLARGLRSESVYLPAEGFLWDQEDLFGRAEALFETNARGLLTMVRGLSVTERFGIDTGRGSRLARAIGKELPRRALAVYRDNYLRLCAEAPEFGKWAEFREHEQTRKQMGDAFAGLHAELAAFSSGREVGALRQELARKYRALLGKAVLPVDDVLPEELPDGMVIPSLSDCYVPPSARVARVAQGDTPSAKEWWKHRELLPDLQRFLAARLTHPDMTRYPTVLLGEPGAGKSKLTEVLAAQLPEEDFLAVRVELRSVSADAAVHTQIEEGLEHDLLRRVRWSELLAEAEGALPVVILDGFDELLQAAGVERYDYLEQIRDFQEHQEDMGQPVAVIVTSRTLSASRARFPECSTVIRLEPFGRGQIERVLRTWNHTNWERFDAGEVRPLELNRLLAYPELSQQPLLLLLLLVYDAQDNGLRHAPESMSLAQLYERLLTTFVRRQVRKHRKALNEKDLKREVASELRRLEATALSMFTRQRQSVSAEDLGDDLRALKLDGPRQQAESRTSLPIQAADLLLGRFFFVHVSQARVGGPGHKPLSAYEFLHATFGEYLVARMVSGALRTLVDERVREEEDPRGEPPGDGLLYATSSFACYSDRERTLNFLRELIGTDIDGDRERRAHYGELLIQLFQQAPYPSADRLHSAYQPRRLPLTSRQALYTANLLTLLLIARAEPVNIRELFDGAGEEASALQQWRSVAALWRALPPADWFTVLGTLRMRHLAPSYSEGDTSLLQLEDLSPVNVGESMGFELRTNVIAGDPPQRVPLSVTDPYELRMSSSTSTGQILRSMALRVNGTAAKLSVGVLPYWEILPVGLGNRYMDDEPFALWLYEHEITYLRLRPVDADPERRLAAYRRLFENEGVPGLDRAQLMALKQAREDLQDTPVGTDYHTRLRRLVREHLDSGPLRVTVTPGTGEVDRVLASLSPYLPSEMVDRLTAGAHRAAPPGRRPQTSLPARPLPLDAADEEGSITDLGPYPPGAEELFPPTRPGPA